MGKKKIDLDAEPDLIVDEMVDQYAANMIRARDDEIKLLRTALAGSFKAGTLAAQEKVRELSGELADALNSIHGEFCAWDKCGHLERITLLRAVATGGEREVAVNYYEERAEHLRAAVQQFLNAAYEWEADDDGLVSAEVPVRMFDALRAALRTETGGE